MLCEGGFFNSASATTVLPYETYQPASCLIASNGNRVGKGVTSLGQQEGGYISDGDDLARGYQNVD